MNPIKYIISLLFFVGKISSFAQEIPHDIAPNFHARKIIKDLILSGNISTGVYSDKKKKSISIRKIIKIKLTSSEIELWAENDTSRLIVNLSHHVYRRINYVEIGNFNFAQPNLESGNNLTLFHENLLLVKKDCELKKDGGKYLFVLDSLMTHFKAEAAFILNQNVKQQVSENQRKSIVQANALNEEKNYSEALKLYENAIGINAFTYPSAYYNMALIAAQIKNYHYAIFNMKRYLILEPNAPDARTAQDKIYEWELKAN